MRAPALTPALQGAAVMAAALLGLGAVVSAHPAPQNLTLRPVIVRAHVALEPVVRERPDGSPYQGTVRTLSGTFSGVSLMAYDADTGGVVATLGTSTIVSIARDGASSQVATVGSSVGGLVYDRATKLIYATEPFACEVVSIAPTTGVVTVVAGSTRCGLQDGQGSGAEFQRPLGITLDIASGVLYVADMDLIRSVTVKGVVKSVTPIGSIGMPDGDPCIQGPNYQGLTYDGDDGDLYLADTCVNIIRQIDPSTGAVSSVAGQCIQGQFTTCTDYDRDGTGSAGLFGHPAELVYDHIDGYLYVADYNNNQIRRVSRAGVVVTLAGSGHNEFSNGVGLFAGFSSPIGMALVGNDTFWVADSANNAVRAVIPDGPPPPPPAHGIALYDPPVAGESPVGLAAASDGSLWYSVPAAYKLGNLSATGQFTEYQLQTGVSPGALAIDAKGAIWFTDGSFIGTFEPATQAVTLYKIPSGDSATDIVIGSDGNPWFVGGQAIGYVNAQGEVLEYLIDPAVTLCAGFSSDLLTLGEQHGNPASIDDVSTQGVMLSRMTFSTLTNGPIAQGPEKHVWIGQPQSIGEIYLHNVLLYELPPAPTYDYDWNPAGLIEGSDGALWFTANLAGYLGRLTTGGSFTPYEIRAARSAPLSIVESSGGSIWFTDPGASKFGRWY